MYFISLLINFILFLYLGYIYNLIDNIIKIGFRLRFEITSMKKKRWFSDWDFQYHNIRNRVKIVYNDITTKTIITVYCLI